MNLQAETDFSTHRSPKTAALARSPLWSQRTETLSYEERVKISYERSKSIILSHRLSCNDILEISPKFWDLQTDPILMMDCSVATLLTIQYNLCAGTMGVYANERRDIQDILEKFLKFELSGQYCLTELGHGLDAANLETTATLLPTGEFELHTPTSRAAKFMPPTAPCGVPVLAVVFARLIINGEDQGVRAFMVNLSDGQKMLPGIVCKVLPPRGAAHPIKHALTYFNHVLLPSSSLLGPLKRSDDPRSAFFKDIYRVITGGLFMGLLGISAMQLSCYIAGYYSLRRTVIDASTKLPRAIITFPTQYMPIIEALAQTYVMRAFADKTRERFVAANKNVYLQHFIAAAFKITAIQFAQSVTMQLGDRCGAQGILEVNQMSVLHADVRGASIAEGDVLVLSIRFGVELLLGRLAPPPTLNPESLLYRHEVFKIEELRKLLPTHHRAATVEEKVLPYCQALIEAVGHRLAYDAAVEIGMNSRLVEMFVASVIRLDSALYTEMGLPCADQNAKFEYAAKALLPDLVPLLDGLNVKDYVTAPIVSDDSWKDFEDGLEASIGDEEVVKSRL